MNNFSSHLFSLTASCKFVFELECYVTCPLREEWFIRFILKERWGGKNNHYDPFTEVAGNYPNGSCLNKCLRLPRTTAFKLWS